MCFFVIFFVVFFSDHRETKPIISFIGDICEAEAIEKAFEGVDIVFHCAAFINFQYPPNLTELERVNVNGKYPDFAKKKDAKKLFYVHIFGVGGMDIVLMIIC